MKRISLIYALAVILALLFVCAGVAPVSAAVYQITIDGPITGFTKDFIHKGIRKAADDPNGAVLIKLDTPGGLISSTQDIVKDILNSPVPVIVYVAPSGARAGSAGTFITLAAHVAAMASGTHIGAAHPILLTGGELKGDAREKVVNDTIAFIRSIAQKRKRNSKWAEEAVKKSVSITAKEALKKGIIDCMADTRSELFKKIEGKVVEVSAAGEMKKRTLHLMGQPVHEIQLSFIEKIGKKLGDPQIMLILLVIGILGIYLEVKTPGATMPGVIGAIALIGFLFASRILPINYLGVILIFLAIVLFIAEIYVTSFGALTVAGLTSLAIGLKILFQTEKSIGLRIPYLTIFGIVAVIGAVVVVLGALLARDFRRKKRTGQEGLVGETGVAKTPIDEKGKVFIHGEIWDACSTGDPIEEGSPIRVQGVKGLLLVVEKVEGREANSK
ncbi:MAG: nodulation protein NfeD [Deltaproteobacteria bacterium]|nr:nodulation protein NfeD [Deltaproteobacteria bacterium]